MAPAVFLQKCRLVTKKNSSQKNTQVKIEGVLFFVFGPISFKGDTLFRVHLSSCNYPQLWVGKADPKMKSTITE